MDDDTLHTLLAQGRLSGAQRDRILERVLEEHAAPRRSLRGPAVVAGVALSAAAAVALAVGMSGDPSSDAANGGWLVPKGDAEGAHLEARCPERAPGVCRHGDRLIFSTDGVKKDAFFGAYAVCGTGERVWYFPAADGSMPSVRAGVGHAVVGQAARIGKEHGTGRCELSLFLVEQRADRASLVSGSAAVVGRASISLEVRP